MAETEIEKVFTPGHTPTVTYVKRQEEKYEQLMARALRQKGNVISIIGPSKSGKTVLVEKITGSSAVFLSGSDIDRPEKIWQESLAQLGQAINTSTSSSSSRTASFGISSIAGTSIATQIQSGENTTQVFATAGMSEAIDVLLKLDRPLVIDDFHYIDRNVQKRIAQQLKEAIHRGLTVIVLAIPHRADDAIRVNPDLRGRVIPIDFEHWRPSDLIEIGRIGFPILGIDLEEDSIRAMAEEAIRSPLLMQSLCLEASYLLRGERQLRFAGIAQSDKLTAAELKKICADVSGKANSQTPFQVIKSGPARHGKARNQYKLLDGEDGDNYLAILRALRDDPVEVSLHYQDVLKRVQDVTVGDAPNGTQVKRSLDHIESIIGEKLPDDRVLEWDEKTEILTVVDPYFLFYLRWHVWPDSEN